MSDLKEMSFLEHLSELRYRLRDASAGIILGTLLAFAYSEELFKLLTTPVREDFPGAQLIGTGPAEAFVVKLKLSIAAGMVLSAPFSFFQVWRFISPGLHEHEKKLAVPFVFVSSLFFILGVVFCFAGVLPYAFEFFSGEFISLGITPQLRVAEYLGFAVTLGIVFGTMFELPVLTFLLARMGLINSKMLTGNIRYAVVMIFIAAGILTPPDVITQILLAGPMCILYALCIWVCKWVEKMPKDAAQMATAAK